MKTHHTLSIALMAFVLLFGLTACSQAQQKSPSRAKSSLEDQQEKLEAHKALAADFIKAMGNSEVEKLKTMITDDFSWWIIGKPEYLATAGEHDTQYFLEFFKGEELFPEGTNFKPTSMIAEGNSVAVEAEFKAKTAMGSNYENYYHFLFIVEDGKIKRMKEYMDTYHAKVTFGL